MLHRMLRPKNCSQGQRLSKDSVWIWLEAPDPGHNRQAMCGSGVSRGSCHTFGWDHMLMRRTLIAMAFTFGVFATASCGGAVKPTATKAPTGDLMTSSATSSPASTIDPKARPAVTAFLNFVVARAEALRNPRKLGQPIPLAADFTKFAFDPVRGQANASIVSLSEQGLLFKGDPGRPRVSVAAIEIDAKPYPKVVLKDCPTPTPTWRIYDAKTGKDMTLPPPSGTQPTPYLSTVEVIFYQGRWGVSTIDADTSRTCTP